MNYVIETRDRMRGSDFEAWADLTPGTYYTRAEALEVLDDLVEDDFGDRTMRTEWRARLLPRFGHEEIVRHEPNQMVLS